MPTVYDYIMKSTDAGIAPTLQDYFQRRALENVEPNLGYGRDAQMVEQPLHNGKHVHFHRFVKLPAKPIPLQEGVSPAGQKISETDFSVMTKPYGDFVPITDEFDLNHIDNMTMQTSDLLNAQARLTIDTVIRDQISAGLNVMYPGTVSSRAGLQSTSIMNYACVKRAVRLLKNNGAQPFPDGKFHAKIDHDTYFDLSADTHWVTVAQQQDDKRVQNYVLGDIYMVRFQEVDNGKIFENETYVCGSETSLTGAATYDKASRTLTISDTLTEDEGRELTGKMVYVARDNASSLDAITVMCVESVDVTAKKVKFRWNPSDAEAAQWTTAKHVTILPSGGNASYDVHETLIYGQNAFGIVKLGGKGYPNIEIIVKKPGSSGSDDPLNQRGSIGWKVKHFCAAILNDDFIVRVEHVVSA